MSPFSVQNSELYTKHQKRIEFKHRMTMEIELMLAPQRRLLVKFSLFEAIHPTGGKCDMNLRKDDSDAQYKSSSVEISCLFDPSRLIDSFSYETQLMMASFFIVTDTYTCTPWRFTTTTICMRATQIKRTWFNQVRRFQSLLPINSTISFSVIIFIHCISLCFSNSLVQSFRL